MVFFCLLDFRNYFKFFSVVEMDHKRHSMHVQGISHWAPANIGPYSQSTRVCFVLLAKLNY